MNDTYFMFEQYVFFLEMESGLSLTRNENIRAIATIIKDFRKGELSIPLDEKHVCKWVSQFSSEVQDIILEETFHVLSKTYAKREKLRDFVNCVINEMDTRFGIGNFAVLLIQKQGSSQNILVDWFVEQYQKKHGCQPVVWKSSADNENWPQNFLYIDDGMYTGRRFYKDLSNNLPNLPEGISVQVRYFWVYDFGVQYYIETLEKDYNTVTIEYNSYMPPLHNKRSSYERPFDIVWPENTNDYNSDVSEYVSLLESSGISFNYAFHPAHVKNSLFSSEENGQLVAKEFLEKGILIIKGLQKTTFRPLGFSNANDLGFGAFVVSDLNISNNCPLVLWWGDAENPNSWGWYPLLPRRDNEKLYKEIAEKEDKLRVSHYKNILLTTLQLAKDRDRKLTSSHSEDFEHFDYNLFSYLECQNYLTIQVIQTVMYIGRDYSNTAVANPDLTLLSWLEEQPNWSSKEIEINQMLDKGPLSSYLARGMALLGIDSN